MPRVLVLLPTSSYRTPDFVKAAERLGVDLAVASEEDPPLEMGDRFIRVDCADPESTADRIVDLADRTPLDAVVAADDAGVVAAALAARKLGLAHHTPEAAMATRDKLELRRRLAAAEVPQPRAEPLTHPDQPLDLTYPLVLKPRTASASEGVLRVDSPEDLTVAYETVRQIADERGEVGPLVIEELIDGEEVAVEALAHGGRVEILAVFAKPDQPRGPTFPETILVTPADLAPEVSRELERVVGAGAAALGLSHGPIHAEAIIEPAGKVNLLELAARSIGGLCGRSLRFGLMGTSLEELILATALGSVPAARRQPRPTGVVMLGVPEAGTVKSIVGVEEAERVPGVTEIDITAVPGDRVLPLPHSGRYLGFVFASAATVNQVTEALRKAASIVRFDIEAAG